MERINIKNLLTILTALALAVVAAMQIEAIDGLNIAHASWAVLFVAVTASIGILLMRRNAVLAYVVGFVMGAFAAVVIWEFVKDLPPQQIALVAGWLAIEVLLVGWNVDAWDPRRWIQ